MPAAARREQVLPDAHLDRRAAGRQLSAARCGWEGGGGAGEGGGRQVPPGQPRNATRARCTLRGVHTPRTCNKPLRPQHSCCSNTPSAWSRGAKACLCCLHGCPSFESEGAVGGGRNRRARSPTCCGLIDTALRAHDRSIEIGLQSENAQGRCRELLKRRSPMESKTHPD